MVGGGWIYLAIGVGRWRDSSVCYLESLDLHETHEQDAAAAAEFVAAAAAAAVAVTGELMSLSFWIRELAVALLAAV